MPTVAITTCTEQNAQRYASVLGGGIDVRILVPGRDYAPPGVLLEGVSGLLLGGDADAGPTASGDDGLEASLDLLAAALDRDMPVLALAWGMQLLNRAFGGRPLTETPGHGTDPEDVDGRSARHMVYLSPGSKLAAILGMGGFFRVNSRHRLGVREPQKAPRLLASAYSLDDGIVEGLESPEHDWVIGVQCCPERQGEVPQAFKNLFLAFTERVQRTECRRSQAPDAFN